jgi:hypothetical protein
MGPGELLARLDDWMDVAADRGARIVELEAERNRLRAVVDAVMAALGEHAPANADQLGDYVTGFIIEWDLLHRERDRLRAVVDELRRFLAIPPEDGPLLADYDRLTAALAQLDASPTGEDT